MADGMVFNPAEVNQKALNEQMHNQPKQAVYPYLQSPDQTLPYTPPSNTTLPDGMMRSGTPAPQPTTTPTGQNTQSPVTFNAQQAAALAAEPAPGTQQPQQPAQPPVTPGQVQPVPGGFQPGDLQQQVLQTGQQKVIEGFDSPVTDLTSQVTQDLLRDPTMGRNYQQLKEQQLSQYDLGAAQAFEQARQATAPISQTGANMEDLTRLALQNRADRARFGSELDQKEYDRMLQDRLAVLGAGREASEMERKRFETDVGGIAAITGAAEGTEQREFEAAENAINRGMEFALQTNDQAFQTSLAELQGKIQQNLQLTEQDFVASQNELDRILQESMQSNDINAKIDALNMQLDFDKWKLNTGIEATKAENELDRALKEAMQSNDIAAQNKIVEMQLEWDKEKQANGFEFTAEQEALNRGLELSLQSNDQGFQEKMLNLKEQIDLNLMTTQNDWQGIQNDLQNQKDMAIAQGNWQNAIEIQDMQQQFQLAQDKQNQQFEIYMNDKLFQQEKWKTQQVENLTKLGWTHEEAMQKAEHDQQTSMQEYDWKKKELMQQGMQEHEADMLAKEYALKQEMQTADHLLTKELEANKISLEEFKLAQQATQFKDEMEFKTWAEQNNVDLAEAQLAWQKSAQSIEHAHDLKMQQLEQDFAEKAMDFQIIMSQLENMNPEQAAEVLKDIASDAGLTYQDTVSGNDLKTQALGYGTNQKSEWDAEAQAMGLSQEEADEVWDARVKGTDLGKDYSVTKTGIKPTTSGMQQQMQTEFLLNSAYAKLDEGKVLTEEEYAAYRDNETFKPTYIENFNNMTTTSFDIVYPSSFLVRTNDARGSNDGKRAWRFTDEMYSWLEDNVGTEFKAKNGEIYRIKKFWEPGKSNDDKNKEAYVTLESLKDGSTIIWRGGEIK